MRFLSLLLSSLVALNPIWAQTGSAVQAELATDLALHVHLVDDPGPAQPQTTSPKGYVLQVTSATGAPMSGAAVALRLPEDGATGRFSGGLRAWVAYSDNAGIARFPVIQWGETAGEVQLKITVAKGTSHAGLLLAQRVAIDTTSISVVSVPMETAQPGLSQAIEIAPPEQHSAYTAKPLTVETAAVTKPAPPQQPVSTVTTPQPGSIFQPLADVPTVSITTTGASEPKDKPYRLAPNPPAPTKEASSEPTVTITNSSTGAGGSESHKKMWIILGVAGGAGAAALFAVLGHGGGGAAGGAGSNSGVTIGAPTITVGH